MAFPQPPYNIRVEKVQDGGVDVSGAQFKLENITKSTEKQKTSSESDSNITINVAECGDWDLGDTIKITATYDGKTRSSTHVLASGDHGVYDFGVLSVLSGGWKQLAFSEDAVLNIDISEAEGFLRKTGAGAYEAIKTNMSASVAPTVNEDSVDGYAVGSRWFDTTADKEYVCLDASVGAAVWAETTGGAGSATWVALTDTAGSITANKLVKGNSGGTALEFSSFDESLCLLADGTRAMTANFNMGNHNIYKASLIQSDSSNNYIELSGGDSSGGGGDIIICGKTQATYPGQIRFGVPNAAGVDWELAGYFEGVSDTPKLVLSHGLNMSSKKIESLLAGTSAADAIRKDQALLLDGTQAMAASLNMDQNEIDAMVFENLATAPHSGAEVQGEVYYDTADDHLYVWVV